MPGASGAPSDAAILEAIAAGGHLFVPDAIHAFYRNLDTGVFCQLTLSPGIFAALRSRMRQAAGEGEAEGASEPAAGGEHLDEVEEDEERSDDEEEEDEDEAEEIPLETAPVTMTVPLFAPSFFGRETFAWAERVAAACGLAVERSDHSQEGGAEAGEPKPVTRDELFAMWDAARRESVRGLPDGKIDIRLAAGASTHVALTVWSEEKSAAWWSYGNAREALQGELGVRAPVLQPAFHGGQVKSLCDWEAGTAIALPRTDLVLVRRWRDKKGLFRTKRVLEEGIADGERIRKILEPHADRRSEPVDLLVFRPGEVVPQAVAADMEVLPLEPVDSARRVPLVGVVDFS